MFLPGDENTDKCDAGQSRDLVGEGRGQDETT